MTMFGWWITQPKQRRKSSAIAKGKTRRRSRAFSRRLTVESLEGRELLSGSPDLQLLKDVTFGADNSSPRDFVDVGGVTYFAANDSQLWKTDGTKAGTELVAELGGSEIGFLYNFSGTLVFGRNAGTPVAPHMELWKSNGTPAGTSLVYDFGADSYVDPVGGPQFITMDGKVFGVVTTATYGAELWASDLLYATGVNSHTYQVADIYPGETSANPEYLTVFDSKLYFAATGEVSNPNYPFETELYWTTGAQGSFNKIDLKTGDWNYDAPPPVAIPASSYPRNLTVFDNRLFFCAADAGDGQVFNGNDKSQLYSMDTAGTTSLVYDFGLGSLSDYGLDPELTVAGSYLYGVVKNGKTDNGSGTVVPGAELWASNGTQAGTVPLEINMQPDTGADPTHLTVADGAVFFIANDGITGDELWKATGTSGTAVQVEDINPGVGSSFDTFTQEEQLVNVNNTLYFTANNGVDGREVWQSDGTLSGTVLAKDIKDGADSSNPAELSYSGGTLYLSADEGSHGAEPWLLSRNLAFASVVGRTDSGDWWMAKSTGAGFVNEYWGSWAPGAAWQDVQTADVNGDRREDLVGRTGGGHWWVAKSTGTGFANEYWGSWAPDAGWQDVQTADVDGDGRDDVVGRTSGGHWWVAKSTGTGFVNEYWGSWATSAGWQDVHAVDLNFDGRSEVVGRTSGGDWWVAKSIGTSFVNEYWGSWPAITWDNVQFADMNGDGRTDIAGRNTDGEWWVAKSTGTGFVNEYWGSWAPAISWYDVKVADVNGDGRADLLGRTSSGDWWVAKSTGAAFANEYWTSWAPITWNDVLICEFV
jgi:ELWxxDGT repeat protein